MKHRTKHSQIDGSLNERAGIYLSSLVGERLTDMDGGFDLKTRASVGATMEFGDKASMEFPDARTAVLKIGNRAFSVGV